LRFAGIDGVMAPERLLRDRALSGVDRPLAGLIRPIVWCEATDSVREVAERIGAAMHSCALVRTVAGIGIVTDHDFRQRVATGDVDVNAPVAELATVPALTIDDDATRAAGLLQMVEHGVHHLVVTEPGGRPIGVVRVVDLAQVEVRDPLLIRSAIETSADMDILAKPPRRRP
jgi:CBS domain-containing protein